MIAFIIFAAVATLQIKASQEILEEGRMTALNLLNLHLSGVAITLVMSLFGMPWLAASYVGLLVCFFYSMNTLTLR